MLLYPFFHVMLMEQLMCRISCYLQTWFLARYRESLR